jgi:U3 small nucleolar RNA-associated protein 4
MSTYLLIVDLGVGTDDQKPRVLRRFDHHRVRNIIIGDRVVKGRRIGNDVEMEETKGDVDDEDESAGPVVASILRMAISSDGQWLATSDDHARTHIFNLDSVQVMCFFLLTLYFHLTLICHQHHCVLPSFPQPVHALSFDPSHPSILIMGFPDKTLQIFDVETRQFPAWSKRLCNSLPKCLAHTHEPILGVAFDPSGMSSPTPTYALFWGSTWMCKVPLNNSLSGDDSAKKRRRESKNLAPVPSSEQTRDVKVITQYRPLLLVDFLEAGEMVVVERPLADVLASLPPAYFKHKYGTS